MTALAERRLGCGLQITELGFGASSIGNLGRPVGDDAATAVVEAAWHGGIRYFDTAPHYGLGLSERRLGRVLSQYPRGDYVLSTKVGRLLRPNPHPRGTDLDVGGFAVDDSLERRADYSADGVRRSLDESLARLGTDRLDVVYVHDPDAPTQLRQAIEEAIPALIDLRTAGIVRAVGAGMNAVAPLRRVLHETDVDILMLAGRYTLLDRSGAALLDECAARGVGVAAAAPFNSGLLARPWPVDGAWFDYAAAPPEMLWRARELARECERLGTTLPHAALRFALGHPAVCCVVVGSARDRHVSDFVRWHSSPSAIPSAPRSN